MTRVVGLGSLEGMPASVARPARWLSMTQLLDRFLADPVLSVSVTGKSKKRQMEFVRRTVRRLERQEHAHMSKIVDGKMIVSIVALEALFPPHGAATVSSLEQSARLNWQEIRHLRRELKKQNERMNDLAARVEILQKNSRDTNSAAAGLTTAPAGIGRKLAATPPQQVTSTHKAER